MNSKDTKAVEEDIDYLHPDGETSNPPPKTKEEAENVEKAIESTQIAEELRVDK